MRGPRAAVCGIVDPRPVLLAAARPLVAVVDDDPSAVRLFERLLDAAGLQTRACRSGREVLDLDLSTLAAVCLDVCLGDEDGVEVLRQLRARDPELPVIMVTAGQAIDTAVEAMRAGAYDYVIKPMDARRLVPAVQRAVDRRALALRVSSLEKELGAGAARPIVGKSPAIRETLALVDRVRSADVPVCLRGETGTGKELFARAIHQGSLRKAGPFVALNCAAIAETLLESELFGHERGAFTGAASLHRGCFEQAQGGTLLLDEVGEMSPAVQASLLRALEERTIRRVGGTADIAIDARIISATHRDLDEEVRAGRFRQDLFYRLVVFPITVPPLRDRRDDVPLLVAHVLTELAAKGGGPRLIEPVALEALLAHDWPGNVRELQNVIVRARLACDGSTIGLAHLPLALRQPRRRRSSPPAAHALQAATSDEGAGATIITLRELERRQIKRALRATNGNMSRAARLLGIGRATLYRKLEDEAPGPASDPDLDPVAGVGR
jgi:DNA-binding NtrC family response regulator